MANEKHDPWALLREARESVFRDSLCREYDYSHKDVAMEEHKRRTRLKDRIDAALAAHDAVPPSEETVEWKTEMGLHATTVNGVNIAVFPMTEDGRWTAALHVADPFDTLDEAQRAAIAAARGMR